MNLVHYSDKPAKPMRSVGQRQETTCHSKPHGLWVSVEGEDDWREWCLSEGFGLERLTHVHDVTLADDENVLRLGGPAGIDAFTREFGERSYGSMGIRWHDVAARWQGIIIAPYVWARRLDGDAGWYYGWDCASGCIWDARAIASVTLREIVTLPERVA